MSFETPRYYPIDEFEYPSVTTIINATIPKFWLAPWSRKMTAMCMRDTIIFEMGKAQATMATKEFIECIDIDQIVKEAEDYPDKIKDEAGDRGKRLHEAIHAYVKGDTVKADDDIAEPFKRFIEWYEINRIKVLFIEEKVWHDPIGYAGRVDWINKIRLLYGKKDKLYITDFKISPRIYYEHQVQVAAYAFAAEYTFGDRMDGAMIIGLGDEKKLKYKELNRKQLKELFHQFKLMTQLYYARFNWEGKR